MAKTNNKLTFGEMVTIMRQARRNNQDLSAVIVYAKSNWEQEYSLESRSYVTSNTCKYFCEDKISKSYFGTCLDGTDPCVRLDHYDWQVEYCYIVD